MVGAERFLLVRLVLAVGLAVAVLASASPAMAQGLTGVIFDFSDSGVIDIQDLGGSVVGQGQHTGAVRCYDGNCGQRTELQVTWIPATIEYKFKNLLVLEPSAERAVVTGTGVISDEDGKEKFAFTATLQNHPNGSVTVRYEASRPDASFIVTAPGTFTLFEKP